MPKSQRPLDPLRKRFRRTIRWVGLSELIGLVVGFILISFCLDYLLELPWIVRTVFLGLILFAYAKTFMRARERLKYDIPAQDLLQTVEEHHPGLEGQLLSATEFHLASHKMDPEVASDLEQELLYRAKQEAQKSIRSIRPEKALNARPMYGRLGITCLLVGLVILTSAWSPKNMKIWAQRNLLLSTQAWPRQTHFAFDRDGLYWRHARKDPLQIDAWVIGKVPRELEITITSNGETRTHSLVPGITRRGVWKLASEETNGAPHKRARIEAQRVSYTLPSVKEDLKFTISGGDNRTHEVYVEVRDRPRVESTLFTVTPPAHTKSEAATLENPAGEISGVVGSKVSLSANVTEEITEAWLQFGQEAPQPIENLSGKTLSTAFILNDSQFIKLALKGGEWNLSAVPMEFALVAYPDRKPEVQLELALDNRLVTPSAEIEYQVLAQDDYGFHSVELVRKVERTDQEKPAEYLKDLTPWTTEKVENGIRLVPQKRILNLGPLTLEPGTRFTLHAQVRDNDEPAGFKLSESQTETFLVVEPEKLKEQLDQIRVEVLSKLEDIAVLERELADRLEDSKILELAQADPNSINPSTTQNNSEINPQNIQNSQNPQNNNNQNNQNSQNPNDQQNQQSNQNSQNPNVQQNQQNNQNSQNPNDQQNQQNNQNSQNPNDQQNQQNNQNSQNPNDQQNQQNNQNSQNPNDQQNQQNNQNSQDPNDQQNQQNNQNSQNPNDQQNQQNNQNSQNPNDQQNQQNQQNNQNSQNPNDQQNQQNNQNSQNPNNQQNQQNNQNSQNPNNQQNQQQNPNSQQQNQNRQQQQNPELQKLAEQQRELSNQLNDLNQRIREMTQALDANKLLTEEEKKRYEEEVNQPLEEIAEDRLPDAANALNDLNNSPNPQADAQRAQQNMEEIAKEIENVAKNLSQSKNYNELLLRLKGIIELQEKAVGESEKELKKSEKTKPLKTEEL